MTKLPYVVVFFSSQAGSGKTTACINLAVSLSEMGKRVLVVPSQKDTLQYLGVQPVEYKFTSLPIQSKYFIRRSSCLTLFKITCESDFSIEQLFTYLAAKRRRYDYIFIDLNHSYDSHLAVLIRADRIVIPYQPRSVDPRHTLQPTVNVIKEIRRQGNIKVDVDIIAMKLHGTGSPHTKVWNDLNLHYGAITFPFYTVDTTYEKEAIMQKIPFVQQRPAHPNTIEVYRKFAEKLFIATPPRIYRSSIKVRS